MRSTRAKTGFVVLIAMLVVAGVSGALADNLSSSKPDPSITSQSSNSGIGGKSWAAIGAEEFASLPKGTSIVDCFPDQKQLPAGSRFEMNPGLMQMHPGLHFLSDGRCASNPNAISIPMRQDNVDGTTSPPQTAP